MPTAAIISLATGGPPAPPPVAEIWTGLGTRTIRKNTRRGIRRLSTRRTTTRR